MDTKELLNDVVSEMQTAEDEKAKAKLAESAVKLKELEMMELSKTEAFMLQARRKAIDSMPEIITAVSVIGSALIGLSGTRASLKSAERQTQIREEARLRELGMLIGYERENVDIVSDRSVKTINEINK